MRPDAQGFFWQDDSKSRAALARKSSVHWGPMPPVRDNGWRPPTEFPNLSAAKVIGLDTETYDPELTDAGPGWGRGKGHIIGASLSVADGSSWYFPIRHGIDENGKQQLPPEHAQMNMDPDNVLRFLDHVLHTNVPKVAANGIYDMGWLNWEGVRVGGKMYDPQFAEALLDSETPNVSLEALGAKYLGDGKVSTELYEWLASWNGKKANDNQRKWLFKTPPMLAGPYAEADASLPIQIMTEQWPLLVQRGVMELFDIECRLIPLMVKMRMKGAPVNLNKAEEVYDEFGGRLIGLEQKIKRVVGFEVNPNAPESIKPAFDAMGLQHPTKMDKDKGEHVVTFDAPRLERIDHPLANLILEHRRLSKVRNTFMKSYILDKHVKSRIHCSFHPLKSDESGTRSGRYSSSDPNLQNIPVQTEEGKLVREAFDGTVFGNRWRSFDYSSIEYRLLAHFATGPGSEELRALYQQDPTIDYHNIVGKMLEDFTGVHRERGIVKRINFGIIYGMQLPSLATSLSLSIAEARPLLEDYHSAAPYAKHTMDSCSNEVHRTGMVRTLLNRASDFNMWGPTGYQQGGRPMPLAYEQAARKWGMFNIERQATHKALNRKLQGSAADVMKVAMLLAYESGLFEDDACGIPCLTVHDELDFEDMGDLDNPAWAEMKNCMENALSDLINVPLLVDGDVGPTWRDAH